MKEKAYPGAEYIYTSPMKRCKETAACIYPGVTCRENLCLKECDFGAFENKNYKELSDNREYQAWIDSNGTLPFPGGESAELFKKRCCDGFRQCVCDAFLKGYKQIAIVTHGGTIMSILEKFAYPEKTYFEWQIKNGEYYILDLDKELWNAEQKIRSVKRGSDCYEM